jgi:hypothetical protein
VSGKAGQTLGIALQIWLVIYSGPRHLETRTGDFAQKKENPTVNKPMRTLLVAAALSALFASTNTAVAQTPSNKPTTNAGKKATTNKKEKHACKGQNSCKGKGGCGVTKAKNDCKGKGECRTDGKPMEKH